MLPCGTELVRAGVGECGTVDQAVVLQAAQRFDEGLRTGCRSNCLLQIGESHLPVVIQDGQDFQAPPVPAQPDRIVDSFNTPHPPSLPVTVGQLGECKHTNAIREPGSAVRLTPVPGTGMRQMVGCSW